MKCPNCNNEIKYCSCCGALLEQEEKTAQSEEELTYAEKYERKLQKTAIAIADIYMEKFPREISYGVKCYKDRKDKTETFYKTLTDEEIKILKEYSIIAEAEGCDLEKILVKEGKHELINYLKSRADSKGEYKIKSFDSNDVLKYTTFYCQEIENDHKVGSTHTYRIVLSDEDYKEILVTLLRNSNNYSMNMLVYEKPEICQRIMKILARAIRKLNNQWLFHLNQHQLLDNKDFAAEMTELKSACDSILDPVKDITGIFKYENGDIREFAIRHQIVPDIDKEEIYAHHSEYDILFFWMQLEGTRVRFSQMDICEDGNFSDAAAFLVDTSEVLEKFSLNSEAEILPYLKEHYSNKDCLEQLKKIFKTVKILY